MNKQNKQAGFVGVIALVIAVLFLGGIIYYTTSRKSEEKLPVTSNQSTSSEGGMMPEKGTMMGVGVEFKSGKLMLDNDGKMTLLTQDYTFENGTKVSLSGKVTKKDGSVVQLKDGQSIWPDRSIVEAGSMMANSTEKNMMTKAGSYEDYDPSKIARAATGKVVLYFHASWCPTCRALDADIRAHLGDIPSGVTILETDYDTETALKQKYGVTIQGTFVQVDQNGNKINKWGNNNTYTLADLLSNAK